MKDSSHFKHVQDELHVYFETTIDRAMAKITNIPLVQKNDLNRLNKSIPNRARPEDFILKMKHSAAYIEGIRNWKSDENHIPTLNDSKNYMATPFAEPYFVIAEHESQIEAECLNISQENSSPDELRTKFHVIANTISNYLKKVGNLYQGNPEQMSKMLLLVLELWVQMDRCAVQLYGLLEEFSPGIPHDLTNVCLLPCLDDLERLHRVQKYLLHRQQNCDTKRTIFDQPSEICFAVQYYDSLPKKSAMKTSLKKIQEDAKRQRDAKEREWNNENMEYNALVAKESTMSHEYFNGHHDTKRCSKCYTGRVIRRCKIEIHEWPLPSNTVQLKTALFELHCPTEISIYRDISWTIMSDVVSMSGERENFNNEFLLSSYVALKRYATAPESKIFSLASTKKAFSMSHYATVKFPARLSDVCLPNGADYRYYDLKHRSWPPQPQVLSFAAHSSLIFPSNSVYSSLNRYPEFAVDKRGPSSYSIIASRTRCPAGILMKEFLAMQALFSGYEHRWPQILIELGSQNINLSNESAYFLMNQLILQVGPRDNDNVRGIVHRIFLDPNFCNRLVYWINWRLDEISSIVKRREVYCMEILLSLALRLFEIGDSEGKKEGFNLVQKAREITLKWLSQLQVDVEHANNSDTREIFSQLAVWVSLLCRRTFIVFRSSVSISSSLFYSYLRSTVSLHENLGDNYAALPNSLRAVLVRDSMLVWSIRHLLRASVNMGEIVTVLSCYVSSLSLSQTNNKSSVTFLPAPYDWCISIKTNESAEFKQQNVILNLLTGNLLVNGKPIGRLPNEWKENEIYQRLFGHEQIKVLSSNIKGMDYMSVGEIHEHKVHFGFRKGKFVIQAVTLQGTLEFLPHEIFLGEHSSDLPNFLISKCAHWLNHRTNCIEICTMTNPWKHKPENWKIDLSKRIASSDSPGNNMILIDPHSSQFNAISSIFKDFEMPSEILVYANRLRYIKIYLPRLELRFFINRNHRFECSELSSEIDPNQDIGTCISTKNQSFNDWK
ncbi:putative p-loop containing nucleoside triphosphate hydrolase [Golovinomyces cichoracearum]|uniref:ubiquitinyl hydrolase 1 n=1 Tax=Golovinomyces cichoracearum TaxID=62708 RepID=A0A420J1F2_9PEZI|nr:putative p-loop containing nucleoside triphosphate hydrolase [Golovinomyces cichoracearum]